MINKNEFVEVLDSSVSVVTRIQVDLGFDPGWEQNFFCFLKRRDRLGPSKSRIYRIPGFSSWVSSGRTEVVNTWSYTATTLYTFDNFMN